MELKQEHARQFQQELEGFNRTFMELKQYDGLERMAQREPF